MTEIAQEMISRAAEVLDSWPCWSPSATETSHTAAAEILTVALGHDTTEPKEHATMQTQTMIDFARVTIRDDEVEIGHDGVVISRDGSRELIAFIQQWLDHDPEAELRLEVTEKVWGKHHGGIIPPVTDEVIAAVRDHDRKYGKE